jgi:hypothetical protein
MKKITYFLVFNIFVILVSCNNPDNKPNSIDKKIDSINNKSNTKVESLQKDSIRVVHQPSKIEPEKPVITAKPADPDKLIALLPNVRGAEKLPPNKGSQTYDNRFWTSVSTDYRYKGGSGVAITINDYYDKTNFPTGELEIFSKTPKEPGYNTTPINNTFGKGFMLMDMTNENGYIYFLINERFTIKVEGYNLSKSIDIQKIFNLIDFKKFNNLK